MPNLFIKGIEVPEKSYLDNNFFTQSYINTNYYTNSYINNTFLTKTDANSNFLNKTNRTSYIPTGDYNPATKKYVDDCIAAINQLHFEIVEELPQVGEPTIIYMILADDGEGEDYYDEYIYINDIWEKIGSTRIDLTPYATITYVDEEIDAVKDELPEFKYFVITDPNHEGWSSVDVLNDIDKDAVLEAFNYWLDTSKQPIVYIYNCMTYSGNSYVPQYMRLSGAICYGDANSGYLDVYTMINQDGSSNYGGTTKNGIAYSFNQHYSYKFRIRNGQVTQATRDTVAAAEMKKTHWDDESTFPVTKGYVDSAVNSINGRINNKQDIIQYTQMPEEASDGTILQYIGETTDEYTNGSFYKSLGEQYKELSSITTLSGYPSQVKLPDTYNFSLDGNKMEFKFAMTGRVSGNQTLMFRNYPFSVYLVRSNSYYWIYGGDGSALDFDASYVADEIHTLIVNDGPNYDAYWDDTLMGSGITENTWEYSRIFNGDPYTVAATGTFYYLKVWDHDTNELIHNLIPAQRESDSAYGIYDTVTHEFYIWEEVVSGYMEVGDYTSNVYQITNWVPLIYTAEDVYTKTEIDEGYASIDYVDNKTGYYTCSITHAFNETTNQIYLRQASELNSIAQAVTNAYQNGEHVLHLKLNWTNGVEFLTFAQADLQQKPTGMALYWFAFNGYPRLFYITGSWSGNTFTCNNQTRIECYGTSAFGFGNNSLFRYGVQSKDVLTKYNTTEFTPTDDYHPATKKYVDDSINAIKIPTMIIEDNNELDEHFWYDYTYGVTLSQTVRNKLSAVINECKQLYAPEATNLVGVPFSFTVKYNTTQIIPGIITVYNSGNLVDDEDTIQLQWAAFNQGTFYNGKLNLDCEWVDGVCTVITEWTGDGNRYTKRLVGDKEVLTFGNQQFYEPTGDYNPATKKYVDDSIANINIPLVEGSHSKLGTDPNTSYWCHVYYAELSLGSIDLDPNTGASRPFIKEDLQNVFNKCLPYLKDINTRHQILLISRDGRQSMTWSFGSGYGWKPSSYQTVYVHVNNAQEDVSSTITFVPTFNSNDEITGFSFYSLGTVNTTGLPVNNTVAYTPTGNYNPATKKYVDDSIPKIVALTQSEYDALDSPDPDTYYFIKES